MLITKSRALEGYIFLLEKDCFMRKEMMGEESCEAATKRWRGYERGKGHFVETEGRQHQHRRPAPLPTRPAPEAGRVPARVEGVV